jgi:hypothetical protein
MPVLVKLLAASVVVTWPALLASDQLPADGALNGKADDAVTGGLVALLLVGLLAAGWLKPLLAVVSAVFVVGAAFPIVYGALAPRECPSGISGMDCLPVSLAAFYAPLAILVVLCGSLVRRVAGSAPIDVLSR